MSISRRNAITGSAAVVAVAAVPVTVQANDAHLEALYADWRAAEGTWLEANRIADNTHIDGLRACGKSPVEGDYTSKAEQLDAAWDAFGEPSYTTKEAWISFVSSRRMRRYR